MATTDNPELPTAADPSTTAQAPVSMFDSLEEERAYYAQKAEQYKTRLNQQVTDLKADTTARVRKGALWGGAFLGCVGLVRVLSGTKKRIEHTDQGPLLVRERESLLWTAAKGAALLGLGVVAMNAVQVYMDQQATAHEQDPGLEPDSTEL